MRVRELREALCIPLALKLSPYFTAFAHSARQLAEAGADGLVLFNRFYQPDLDLETLDVSPQLTLSQSWELRLALRWIAVLCGRVPASLAATGGVHTAEDAVKALLVGADVTMMASALLQRGPEHLSAVRRELEHWLDAREYESVRQLRGSASQRAIADPAAYERANYMKTLRSYAPRTAL